MIKFERNKNKVKNLETGETKTYKYINQAKRFSREQPTGTVRKIK